MATGVTRNADSSLICCHYFPPADVLFIYAFRDISRIRLLMPMAIRFAYAAATLIAFPLYATHYFSCAAAIFDFFRRLIAVAATMPPILPHDYAGDFHYCFHCCLLRLPSTI